HAAEVTDLLEGMWNELLAAETGVDAHDEYGVEVMQDIAQQFDGGTGVKGNTGLHSERFDLLDVAVQVCAGFQMDGEPVRACLSKVFGVAFRFEDHEVDVKDLFCRRPHGGDNGEAYGDVGDKPAVHNI